MGYRETEVGGPHPEHFVSTFPSDHTKIDNNILHVEQGYAMNFAADSGVGSTIDYNDLHVVGSGKLGRWQNRDFSDVADWFYELGFDQHSQTADPQFANAAGPDGVMGYRETEVGGPQILDNGDAGFSVAGPWQQVSQADGNSGDFLENATNAAATWAIVGSIGYPAAPGLSIDVPISAFWKAHPGLGTATYTHNTVASYTVTYNTGSGNFNSQQSTNFSGPVTTIAQASAGDGWHALGTLHLTFPNLFAQNGFVSVSGVTITTTLRITSAADVIADAAMAYGNTVDDGDAGFTKEGTAWVQPGRAADYHVRPASSDQGAATWEFTALTPGASYSVAALWSVLAGNSNSAAFTIFDGDNAVHWTYRDLMAAPNDFTDLQGVKWNRLGVVKVTGDRLRVKLEGAGKLQADAIRIQQLIGDRAADDDFHVGANSPTIDAGNPSSAFGAEPAPSGGRVNLGHTGNTGQATTSPAQFVQVLAPNGREKFEQGQPISIQWRQSGIPSTYAAGAITGDNPAVYFRLDETAGTVATDSSTNGRNGVYTGGTTLGVTGPLASDPVNRGARFDGVDDFVDVPGTAALAPTALTLEAWINPDPTIGNYATLAMKTTSSAWTDGYGIYWFNGKLRFFVNNYSAYVETSVPVGAWSHVAGTYDGATLRFYVNGTLTASAAYAQLASASGQTLQVGRGQGNYYWKGMIDEFALFSAALNSGQITQHMSRQDFGAVKIELENQATYAATTLAASTPNDGEFGWTIPAGTAPGPYTVRVTAAAGILSSDESDASFLITSAGHDYYVNDASTAGDAFTTAIGNNANDGRSPGAPMAGLAALLAAYDLDAGDVIHVDTGDYTSLSNIVLDASESGVRIEGPGAVGAAGIARLTRGNTVSGSYAIQLTGADDVTLDWLEITGGEIGVVAMDYTDSDRLTITNSQIHDNSSVGVYIGNGDDNVRIEHNTIFNNARGGITSYYNVGAIVRTNVIHHNSGLGGTGVSITSASGSATSIVSGNESYNQDVGISANGTSPIQVTGNSVHHNYSGISAANNVVVSQNESFFNQGYHWSIGYGISATNATVVDNVTHDNDRGVDASGSLVRGNRIYNNRDTGVQAGGSNTIIGNTIYASALGIRLGDGDKVFNNLIYQNSNDAIWTWRSNGARIENNTIFAATGDAIQVGGPHADQFVTTFSTNNLTISNNILRVAQGYAINVAADSELGFSSDYNDFVLTDAGKVARWEDRDFSSTLDWSFEIGVDAHSVAVDPQFIDLDGADNVLGYDFAATVDRGQDDNFRVPSTSRTVDAGDPRSVFVGEPGLSGGRVNLGHTGNTAEAATSPSLLLQILSPNGLEKVETGQSVNIQWHAEGLTQSHAVALIDAGGNGTGSWSANAFQTAGQASSFATPVNLSGVTNPAPAATYQDGTYGGFGAGNRVAYDIPAADGAYTIRLHFVEPTFSAGQRVFDIKLNGVIVRSGFDIFAAAGGQFKATTLSFPVTASAGSGISLEMVNPSNTYGAFVTGIEVTAANPAGVANPTVNLLLSTNGGTSWSTIATGVSMDQYGQGSYPWTAGPETVGATALIGVASTNFPAVQDTSDAAFLIANAGANYYVNDGANAGDVFATAPGDNLNSGKSPAAPMASLRALLATYDLDPGDVVHVDTGTYRVYRNLTLGGGQSGVRIEGPGALPAGQAAAAVVNRGNSASGSYVFEFAGADDVTLDHLAVTGGTVGVYAPAGVQSNRLTISNSDLYANVGSGAWNVYIGGGNVDFTIRGSKVHSNSDGSAGGVYVEAARANVENNDIFGNTTGVSTTYFGDIADRILVSGNQVHGNSSVGISSANQALVTGNTVYDQLAAGAIGIRATATSQPSATIDNIVYSNTIGMFANSANGVTETMQNNRVFKNGIGIRASGVSQILGNQVYSNGVGIGSEPNYGFSGRMANNVIYSNLNQGIYLSQSFIGGGELLDNTIYQPVGEAIRLENVTQGMLIRNNILEVDSGYAIYASANSQSNIASNYNLIHLGVDPNAHVGFWGGAARHTLGDWTAATTLDAGSLVADPLFVDRDGADNGLGFTTVDRGADDNFNLKAGSPAIDRGDRWNALDVDIDGLTRRDDPGTTNAGRNDYMPTPLATNLFAATGTAQNWRSNDNYAQYNLPFAFPFYDGSYTTVFVSTEGYLQLGAGSGAGDGANSTAKLRTTRRIAPLWDNLRTNGTGDDIFVDATIAGQVTFRWNATNEADSSDVQFAVTVFNDGRIRFDYGPGANLSPTVGLSMANDRAYALLAGYDAAASLAGANSVMWQLAPSFVDIGAYEFRGSSLDALAPSITATTPPQVFASGAIATAVASIRVTFSEEINPIDARANSNYELRNPGPGGVYGDANDVVLAVNPQYAIGTNYVDLALPAGALADGQYRLTIFSNAVSSIHDLAGLQVDGDANLVAGGDFVRNFTVASAPPLLGDLNGDHRVSLVDVMILQSHYGITSGATSAIGDLNGDGAVNRKDAALMMHAFGSVASGGASPAAPVAEAVVATVATERMRTASPPRVVARTTARRAMNGSTASDPSPAESTPLTAARRRVVAVDWILSGESTTSLADSNALPKSRRRESY
jgi:hypothetical protein